MVEQSQPTVHVHTKFQGTLKPYLIATIPGPLIHMGKNENRCAISTQNDFSVSKHAHCLKEKKWMSTNYGTH